MTAFVLTIEGLFLVLAIFAETMDEWTLGVGFGSARVRPEKAAAAPRA